MKTQLRSWLAPFALALFSAVFGFYLLLGPTPRNHSVETESTQLDAELLQYLTIQAENYAKENTENSTGTQTIKKADPI